jgi:regulatory protein
MKRPSTRPKQATPQRKRIRIPTPEYLANVALYYLSRFATSEASLRRVLKNRLKRAAIAHEAFAADAAAQETLRRVIDSLVEQHRKTGVLNDAAYAAMKTGSMRRSGRSARRITQHLQQKGIAPEIIERTLKPQDEDDTGDAESKAALAFARRRKLGLFRKDGVNPKNLLPHEQRRKDFATMARAGFAYDTARDILGGEFEDEE